MYATDRNSRRRFLQQAGLGIAALSMAAPLRRAWADAKLRPMWGDVCETLEPLITVPRDAALSYDPRLIAFLQEDRKDLAETQQKQAATLKSLIDAGFKPATAIAAVQSGDWSKLQHTGLYSVQLQPPGTEFTPTPSQNGNGNGSAPAALPQGG